MHGAVYRWKRSKFSKCSCFNFLIASSFILARRRCQAAVRAEFKKQGKHGGRTLIGQDGRRPAASARRGRWLDRTDGGRRLPPGEAADWSTRSNLDAHWGYWIETFRYCRNYFNYFRDERRKDINELVFRNYTILHFNSASIIHVDKKNNLTIQSIFFSFITQYVMQFKGLYHCITEFIQLCQKVFGQWHNFHNYTSFLHILNMQQGHQDVTEV